MAPQIEEMAKRGLLSEEEAATHPARHTLREAVMGEPLTLIDNGARRVGADARLLLCSDGVQTLNEKQIEAAVEKFLDKDYGADTFAQFASNSLGVSFDGGDFSRSTFDEADKAAREKAGRAIGTTVYESIEENLGAEDANEWNWQALVAWSNTRYGLTIKDRDLRKYSKNVGGEGELDRVGLEEFLTETCSTATRERVCPRCGRPMNQVHTTFALCGSDKQWKVPLPVCPCSSVTALPQNPQKRTAS